MDKPFSRDEFRRRLQHSLSPSDLKKIEVTVDKGWAEPNLNEWSAIEVMEYDVAFDERGMLYCQDDICIPQDLWKPTENLHQAALVAAHAGMDYTIRGYIDGIRVHCKWGNEWKDNRLHHGQAHEIPQILVRGVYDFLEVGQG